MWATIFSCCLGKKEKRKKNVSWSLTAKLYGCQGVFVSSDHPATHMVFYKLQCDLRLGVKNKGIHLSNHQNKSGNHCKKKKLKDNLRFVRKRAVSYGSTLKKKEAK